MARVDAASGRVKSQAEARMADFMAGQQADQSIILASRTGQMMCLRSDKAPKLKPSELTEVLRNDEKIKFQQEATAKQLAQADQKKRAAATEEKKQGKNLFGEEDWLRSMLRGRPLGSRLTAGAEEKGKKATKPAKEEKGNGKEAKGGEGEEG